MAAAHFAFNQDKAPVVDVHFHYFAPHILRSMGEFVIAAPDETEGAMTLLGTTAVIYSPVIWSKYSTSWSSKKWADLCRQLTDAQAAEVSKNPTHRGSFAPLPLPHLQETLAALKYGEETCQPRPDGYAITTSARNVYLGNSSFDPIWDECNKKGVTLFVHPNETVMPPSLDPETYGWQMIEFPTETARCLMNMVDTGVFARYPNVKWIFSHNGGSFPFLYQRVIRTLSGSKLIGVGGPNAMAKQINRITMNNNGKTLEEVFSTGNIYIECSQGTADQQVVLRAMGVKPQNILMGSDWPFTGKVNVDATLAEMNGPENSGLYTKEEVDGIRAGNALSLLPRLAASWVENGMAVRM
ncbi:hypothetical protein FANTH_7980 [Fusarium anthophilum]|uniref:Amidohydrolase-related domain-containing protein n=1 Tax=Fusarium anthophilum TaxID=48485 RepID=A0A8H4ZBV9_9HYPO|nr:hypothetical protein FANTH_7980 [Fusarium anthophilum]